MATDSHLPTLEALSLEASRLYGRERGEILRPLLVELAKDMILLSRLPLASDEEP